jgi:hypothetical protein
MKKVWKNILGWSIYALLGAGGFGLLAVSDGMCFWVGILVWGLTSIVALLLGTACWLIIQ